MINRNYFRHLKGIQIFNVCTNYRKNLYFQESWFKNFKFFSFYSSFRKTKFFSSSSFFKAFTNASHKIFLKHLVNYSLSVWWELDFWQAVKSITSSECTYSSVKILEILSHLKVKNSFQCARDSCLNWQNQICKAVCLPPRVISHFHISFVM